MFGLPQLVEQFSCFSPSAEAPAPPALRGQDGGPSVTHGGTESCCGLTGEEASAAEEEKEEADADGCAVLCFLISFFTLCLQGCYDAPLGTS